MYQVVASDLDGTLLSPDHTLSPYAKETLKLLTARGVNFVFATGRHHVDVGQIRDNLEIKSYMITSNGARVHDLDGNLIFAHNLDRDIASDLFGVVNDNPDIITNVYRDDEWFMNRHRPEEMRFFKEAVFKYALYEPGLLEPEGVSKVFFTNAGADANENAIRMARLYTGRDKVLSAYRSYHGNTGSAIAATGDWRRVPNEYSRGHVHFFNPYLYRSEFNATTEQEECTRALAHLRRMIECEGPASIAAILLESIPGTAGILVPPDGYMKGVRALADEFGIILILDEVMAGFGRTGSWFAFEQDGVVPDLVTFAKGVNAGYVPAGGVLISEPIARYFDDHFFAGGLTYSGHPLAMAAIVATIDAMKEENVVENAATIGNEVLRPGLEALAEKHAIIGNVRGRGLFQALELVSDREAKTPLTAADMAAIKGALTEAGLLAFVVENRIHVVPPCTISAEQIAKGLAIFDSVFARFATLAK